MHFIWGDNDAGTCFFYLASSRWIQIYQVNFELLYHFHSSLSNSLGKSPNKEVFLCFCLGDLNFCSHPSLACFSGDINNPSSVTLKTRSIFFLNPTCWMTVLGILTPNEFPI